MKLNIWKDVQNSKLQKCTFWYFSKNVCDIELLTPNHLIPKYYYNTIPALHSPHYYDNPKEYKLTEEIIWSRKSLEEVWSTNVITVNSFYRITE